MTKIDVEIVNDAPRGELTVTIRGEALAVINALAEGLPAETLRDCVARICAEVKARDAEILHRG